MRDFHELSVWRKAHRLTIEIYKQTKSFPGEERFGLTSQLRRAAYSVPSNIAEGCGRESDKDFKRFLSIAAGSISEVEYQLLLTMDLGYLPHDTYRQLDAQANDIKKMLNSFIQALNKKTKPPRS